MIIKYVLRFKLLYIVVYSICLLLDGNHSLLLDLAGSLLPVQLSLHGMREADASSHYGSLTLHVYNTSC